MRTGGGVEEVFPSVFFCLPPPCTSFFARSRQVPWALPYASYTSQTSYSLDKMKRARSQQEFPVAAQVTVPSFFAPYGDQDRWLPELSCVIFQHLGEDSPTAVSLALTCKRELAIFDRIYRCHRRPPLIAMMATRAFHFGDLHLWSYAVVEKKQQQRQRRLSLTEQAQLLGLLMPGTQIDMVALSRVHLDNVVLSIHA